MQRPFAQLPIPDKCSRTLGRSAADIQLSRPAPEVVELERYRQSPAPDASPPSTRSSRGRLARLNTRISRGERTSRCGPLKSRAALLQRTTTFLKEKAHDRTQEGGGAAQRLPRRGPAAYRSGARRRTRDRQDHAVGGRDRRRPRARRRGARGARRRGRGPALLRRADRSRRRARSRRRSRRRSGRRWRSRCCGAAQPEGAPPQPHAIGLGLRNALAAAGPTLVAVDDIQWLDAPSAEALAFAAGVCMTRRSASCSPAGPVRRPCSTALERGALERVHVGSLGVRATRRLLAERLGLEVEPPCCRGSSTPRSATRCSRWRSAGCGGGRRGRGFAGPARGRGTARHARQPGAVALPGGCCSRSRSARPARGRARGDRARGRGARRGASRRRRRAVRAAHPSLAAVARANARPREKRELHRLLAELTREPEQRALHLALATAEPDEALAAGGEPRGRSGGRARRAAGGGRARRTGVAPHAGGGRDRSRDTPRAAALRPAATSRPRAAALRRRRPHARSGWRLSPGGDTPASGGASPAATRRGRRVVVRWRPRPARRALPHPRGLPRGRG